MHRGVFVIVTTVSPNIKTVSLTTIESLSVYWWYVLLSQSLVFQHSEYPVK
jgi:hypothetical protein